MVGDYVRTRWGCIAKFEGIHEGFYEFDNIIMDESSAVREELFVDIVEKSSPNIIDLIEVGDYVNGMIVHCVYADRDEIVVGGLDILIQDTLVTLRSNNIKSIVTKEAFSSVEYRVENN